MGAMLYVILLVMSGGFLIYLTFDNHRHRFKDQKKNAKGEEKKNQGAK